MLPNRAVKSANCCVHCRLNAHAGMGTGLQRWKTKKQDLNLHGSDDQKDQRLRMPPTRAGAPGRPTDAASCSNGLELGPDDRLAGGCCVALTGGTELVLSSHAMLRPQFDSASCPSTQPAASLLRLLCACTCSGRAPLCLSQRE
jgi:hypothetical protein